MKGLVKTKGVEKQARSGTIGESLSQRDVVDPAIKGSRQKDRKSHRRLFTPMELELLEELKDCRTVLDLGCGAYSPVRECSHLITVGVDIWDECLEETKRRGIHDNYIKADVRYLHFEPKSFDAVLLLELVEHLDKEDGERLIKSAELWARKKLIVSTPNGFLWEDAFDGNPYQVHKSGWTVEDFLRLGFEVRGRLGWNPLRGYGLGIRFRPDWFWIGISWLTQKVTRYFPELAAQLCCVKTTE